ncbi:MAG: ATP-binding cassette domain-containing protein [Clostridiales bacterium]|nr:ATP-binding cassette domain-containing protein [Clostridiales bacterium]
MIRIEKLCKSYDGKPVLEGLSLHLEEGQRYALMGASGSGKTTLLNLLMALETPDSGLIRMKPGLRISAVFQENRLLEMMTAEANIRLVAPEAGEKARELLLLLGIEPDSLPQPVKTYSGGMKRRVAIARALLADYDLLLLDEPYKGLDEDTRQQVIDTVKRMTEGKTVLMVTHDPEDTAGQRLIELKGTKASEPTA